MTNFLKKDLTSKDVLAFLGMMTLIVIVALGTFYVGAKTALALEPYVKGYDIVSYETYTVCQGDTFYEIAEEHLDFFPETGKENRLKCFAMTIAQYNGIYEPSAELKWGKEIKIPIVIGSAKPNSITVG